MNYEPNTTQWKPGDLVIHDADAKRVDMLMLVVRYRRDGLVVSRYVNDQPRGKRYVNELRYLHDPSRFGITKRDQ